jgi:uncharacterized protein (TIGR03790 family)
VNTGRKAQNSKRIIYTLAEFLFVAAIVSPSVSTAANSGDEVVVIYNSRVPESKSVAEHYAGKRQVPKEQIFGFELTTAEEITRAEFRDQLQQPLSKKLETAKLWRFGTVNIPATNGGQARIETRVVESKIRYAVLCYGVPLKIVPDPNLKEAADEKLRPELRRNGAAVDSELALLPSSKRDLPLAGPMVNPLFGTTNGPLLHPTNGILMVARLDGPTSDVARQLVDKAIEAEENGYWGRAYIDLRNTTEPGMKMGDDWMRATAEFCKHAGFQTVVDTNGSTFPADFPMSHIAFYAGWYVESIGGPFLQPKVEFMPGAFAYHLQSFSAGTLRKPNQHWTGPLLARGATCSMGCVDEPYLGGTPDLGVFSARFLILALSFGEAAWASQNALSWQTTVVGDPLFRPFKKPPRQLHEELEARHNPLIEWSHVRVLQLNLARNASLLEMTGYLEGIKETRSSAVLSESLAELYAEQGKPSSAAQFYEQALKLAPSPQQKIRLRLALGEKLMTLNRDEDAFANFKKFIEENVNYPDKVPIYRKLAALAQKLGKNEEQAKWENLVKLLTPPK